jgi:hypothetical protein
MEEGGNPTGISDLPLPTADWKSARYWSFQIGNYELEIEKFSAS